MKKIKNLLNKQEIDKYILDEFGEIPNPPTKDEIIELINKDKLTLEQIKLWSLFGGDLMIKDQYGDTILHSASFKGQLDIVQFIIGKGVNVDILNNRKSTPLILASINGQFKVINLLLENGTNINHQAKNDWSALHYTCNCNQLESVKVLVEKGIDIHLKNNDNKTAFDIIKYSSFKQMIDYLTPFYNNN